MTVSLVFGGVGMTVVNTKGVKKTVTHNLTRNAVVPTDSMAMTSPFDKDLRALRTSCPRVGIAARGPGTVGSTSVIVLTMGP